MIKVICWLFFLSSGICGHAQILKRIKKEIEYKAERAASDKVSQGIDSLTKPKNDKTKKDVAKEETKQTVVAPAIPAVTTPAAAEKAEQPAQDDDEGHITLELSTPVTTKGLSVIISGESIKYDKWKTVALVIKAPDNTEEKLTLPLTDSGKYRIKWDQLIQDGEYTITATGSNGKGQVSKKLWVMDIYQPDDGIKDLMAVTGEAFNRLSARASRLKSSISSKDAAQLDTKTGDVKKNLDALHEFLNSLEAARKEVADLYKAGKPPSQYIKDQMSELNQEITSKAAEIKKISQLAEHEPSDNSVCEYLVMLTEACAAFSTISTGWTTALSKVIKNIIFGKAVPTAAKSGTSAAIPHDKMGEIAGWGAKEASKIYAKSKLTVDALNLKLTKANFASDIVQFASEVLMKIYCGVFKGKLSHHYKLISRNAIQKTWLDYGVQSEAAISLRYPKSSSGDIIKMKGNIEGNATKFEFFADPDENPGYKAGTGGKVQTMIIKSYTPVTLPFATSLHDILGFGMIARGVATPAYFNIPIDAEYNTKTEKIKIFINEALVDFNSTPFIHNRQFFIQWVAGLPKLRIMDYPISNARLTIFAALKDKNEFEMEKDVKGVLFFGDQVLRHIGDETNAREHFLEINISAKKE